MNEVAGHSWVHICAGGGECLIEASVLRLGRTIAVVQVTLRNKQTGTLTAHGTHTKFLSGPPPHRNMKASEKPQAKL